jgi:lysophospholipase L1-like esterase
LASVEGGGFFSVATAAVIGDSITRLNGFSGVAKTLSELFNPTVGDGPTAYHSVRGTFPWDTVQGTQVAGRGLCGLVDELNIGEYDEKLAVKGAHYQFYWSAGAPGSQLELRVGGSLVQTVDASVRGSYFYDATTYAARDVRMTCVTANGARADGVRAYTKNNHLFGVVWNNYGHSGSSTMDKINNPDILAEMTASPPNLIVIATGINDSAYVDPGSYYTNMTTWVETLKAACPNSSFALWIPPETGGHSPWTPVAEYAHRICREQNIEPIDLFAVMGQYSGADPDQTDDPFDFTSDGVHFTSKAQRLNSRVTLSVVLGGYRSSISELTDYARGRGTGLILYGTPYGEAEATAAKQSVVFHRSIVGLEYVAVMDPTKSNFRPLAVESNPANSSFAANRDYVDRRKIVTKAASWAPVAGGSESGVTYEYTGAGAAVFTVPANSTNAYAVGTKLEVMRTGAGAVTWTPAGGVTVDARGGATSIIQHGVAVFTKKGTNSWSVTGDIS